jgi:DNA-binding CsgD family transcriptional regulator
METLSPRQRDCLQLVWERQATSKEIAAELGISKSTVDGYIAEAVEALGARDRRAAAALAFGNTPRAPSGGDTARVAGAADVVTATAVSTNASPAPLPWRSRSRPRNTLTFIQTLGWIAAIAIGSLMALTLATVIGAGVPPVARSVQSAFGRLAR